MRVDFANDNCNFCPLRTNEISSEIFFATLVYFYFLHHKSGGPLPTPPPVRSLRGVFGERANAQHFLCGMSCVLNYDKKESGESRKSTRDGGGQMHERLKWSIGP